MTRQRPRDVRKLYQVRGKLGIDGTSYGLTAERRNYCRMKTRASDTQKWVRRATRIRCIYVRQTKPTTVKLDDDGGRHRSSCCLRASRLACLRVERASERAGGGKVVAFASHSAVDGRRPAEDLGRAWDKVRWPAVAATLRGRGRVCLRGGRDCIGWPRRYLRNFPYVYAGVLRIPYSSAGSESVPRILVHGASAHSRLVHGTGTCFLFPCFYRGRMFFKKKPWSSTRAAQRAALHYTIL